MTRPWTPNYLDPLLKSDLGGSYHRLFDGGHTLGGAFRAARDASPDDTPMQETMGAVQGLLRDGTTPRGLPLANWDKGTFDSVAGLLESTFGIPKDWFYDLNTYDAAEVLGGTVGAIALIFGWNRADTETFAKLVGSMGLVGGQECEPPVVVGDRRRPGEIRPQGAPDRRVRGICRRSTEGRIYHRRDPVRSGTRWDGRRACRFGPACRYRHRRTGEQDHRKSQPCGRESGCGPTDSGRREGSPGDGQATGGRAC